MAAGVSEERPDGSVLLVAGGGASLSSREPQSRQIKGERLTVRVTGSAGGGRSGSR